MQYYNYFVKKYGIEVWNYDTQYWQDKGYTIDKNTGYLIILTNQN